MIRLYVDDRLGATELTHLRAGDLDDLYGQMLRGGRRDGRGGLSPRTVRYLHTILNKALSDAVRTGRLRLKGLSKNGFRQPSGAQLRQTM